MNEGRFLEVLERIATALETANEAQHIEMSPDLMERQVVVLEKQVVIEEQRVELARQHNEMHLRGIAHQEN